MGTPILERLERSRTMYPVKSIKPQQMAQMLGISVRRLQILDKMDIVPARRSDTDRRYYLIDDYYKYQEIVRQRKLQSHR